PNQSPDHLPPPGSSLGRVPFVERPPRVERPIPRAQTVWLIICTQSESSHAIINSVELGYQDNWCVFAAPSPSCEQLKPSLPRKHHVEHDRIIAVDLSKCFSFFCILGLIHGMAKALEGPGQRGAETVRILNERQTHGKATCEVPVPPSSLAASVLRVFCLVYHRAILPDQEIH